MSELGQQILLLSKEGLSYQEIALKLSCAKSTVCYYINPTQKNKSRLRTQKRRKKHPFISKREHFLGSKKTKYKNYKTQNTVRKKLQLKIETFFQDRKNNMKYQKPDFTLEEVIDKFGENPKCYLTGKLIDIYKPHTYHFDHIKPVSRGGDNSLDNLGICIKEANMAKSNLTVEEFIELCQTILNYQAAKSGIEPETK